MYNELHRNEALQQQIVQDRKAKFEQEARTARITHQMRDEKTTEKKGRLNIMLSLLVSAR